MATTTIPLSDVITPATPAQWLSTLLAGATTLGLSVTSWQSGAVARTLISMMSWGFSSEDAVISMAAQGGFLDYAAGGSVSVTNPITGAVTTVAVTVDPSLLTGTALSSWLPGWLDILADGSYNCQRIAATQATGLVNLLNTSASVYGPFAAGTYHISNPTTGATYSNAATLTIGASTTTTAQFVADLAGSSGTATVGQINATVTALTGVSVTNSAGFVGQNAESNAALAARCRLKLQSLSVGGPKGAYQYFALSALTLLQAATGLTNPLQGGTVTRATTNTSSGVVTTIIANASGAVSGVANLSVTGAANNGSGLIRLTVTSTTGISSGTEVQVSGVVGVSSANNYWSVTVIDGTHLDLVGSTFSGTYVSGGVVEAGDLGLVDSVIQANVVPLGTTAITQSAGTVAVTVAGTVYVPTAQVSAYTAAFTLLLGAYFSTFPIGGVNTDGGTNLLPIGVIEGLLYQAGLTSIGGNSYVAGITGLTLNGAAADLTGLAGLVPSTPTLAITVVGQ